ncbi:MAG: adenylyltransferase/cytidyltransferase family protein [Candidatus Pacebacteria bacterium]|nr:adenylyltransferase/cytidyltransferase family protein [Candidatus Paceibacterota bacterium]
MRKILVFGTFDNLHKGHLSFFRQTKKYGDYLIAVVARDNTVKKIKKRSPFKSEKERLRDVSVCKLVNKAVLGYRNNPYRIIKEINPDVICLGYDQKTFIRNLSAELKKINSKIKLYKLKAYKPGKFHSTILNKIK